MKKIVIVQSVIPNYSMSFFNGIVEKDSDIELYVIADIKSKNSLNQFDLNKAKFKVVHYKSYDFKFIKFHFGLRKLINSIDPDTIVFSGDVRSPFYLCLMAYYKYINLNVFSWGMFHRIGPDKFTTNLIYKLYSYLSKSVLTYGQRGKNKLIDLKVKPNKIKVIGTAIDESISLESAKNVDYLDVNKIKNKYDLNDCFVVLQVVRLSKIKKPMMLIDVADYIVNKNDNKNVKFILIGDGELRPNIEREIKSKSLEENVILLGSIYSESELAKWFTLADIYVIPTCIGLSAHHAMSYGLPIITDNSYLNQASEFELLFNGLNSLTYEEGDVMDFSLKIMNLLNNKNEVSLLSKNAKHTVTFIYNLDNKIFNFLQAIDYDDKKKNIN